MPVPLRRLPQYWLGAYLFVEDGGAAEDGSSFDVAGADDPYDDATTDPWPIDQVFEPGRDATNQSFVTTSSILKDDEFPQFTSTAPGVWDTPFAGAYEPHSGDFYMYSQRADIRYQRLMNTFEVDSGTDLSFFISHDTEPAWDFVFVEIQGEDGSGSRSGGERTHGHQHRGDLSRGLARAPSVAGAVPGRGLRRDRVERGVRPIEGLDRVGVRPGDYAGQEVTVSISYASDWAAQGLGVWVDDITAPTTEAGVSTDFEGDMGSWTIGDPIEIGSGVNVLDWNRSEDVGFVEGAMASMTPTGRRLPDAVLRVRVRERRERGRAQGDHGRRPRVSDRGVGGSGIGAASGRADPA